MLENCIEFRKNKQLAGKTYEKLLELERFGDGSVAVEARCEHEVVILDLDYDDVKKLAKFVNGLIGMMEA